MRKSVVAALILAVACIFMISSALFEVKETEYAVVTQFGKPVRVLKTAGLCTKIPDPVQSVRRFDKRLLIYNVKPSEFLTSDKKNVVVEPYLTWRIQDPMKFLVSVRDRRTAELLLADLTCAEVGAAIGRIPLSSIVSVEPGAVVVDSLMQGVTRNCCSRALDNYGIDVTDVRVMRLSLPDQNLASVYQRMRSERQRMAKRYRSEGEEEAIKIRAEADTERRRILAEAYRDAERIRGLGEAEAAGIYSGAYGQDPRFYKMVRTLQAYEKFLNDKTTLVISTESELLKLLEHGQSAE
ncbi:MAG: protease modulator HflC [bacterium]